MFQSGKIISAICKVTSAVNQLQLSTVCDWLTLFISSILLHNEDI